MQLGHKMRLGEFQEINIAILSPLQTIAWRNIVIAWFQSPESTSMIYCLLTLWFEQSIHFRLSWYVQGNQAIAIVEVSFFSVFIFAPDDVDKLLDCRWRENN